jgi:hypothetical protein
VVERAGGRPMFAAGVLPGRERLRLHIEPPRWLM